MTGQAVRNAVTLAFFSANVPDNSLQR